MAAAGLTVGTALAACLPVIVSIVHGLQESFYPNGDRAVIAVRAYDVLTSHPPLVGQYSASSVLLGQPVHSAGPMLYWLLAIPAHISPGAIAVTMALANVASIIGVVLLARRRGGPVLMLGTAAAVALMARSLVPETFHDIWNPAAGVLPLMLLAFLAWSVACGDYRLLPLTIVVASFVAQCQLAFVAPSFALVAVAAGGLLAWRLLGSRGRAKQGTPRPDGAQPPEGPTAGHPPRLWPWWLGALAVGLICWSAPIVDQLIHHPGNLGLLARLPGAQGKTEGLAVGWHTVVRAVGIPPWWLRAVGDPFGRLAQVTTAPPGGSSTTWCIVLLGLLVVSAAYVAVSRRRGDVVAGAAITLVLCVTLGGVAAATPTRPSLVTSLAYALWWGSPAGMWVWLMLVWSLGLAARALVVPIRPPEEAPSASPPATGEAAGESPRGLARVRAAVARVLRASARVRRAPVRLLRPVARLRAAVGPLVPAPLARLRAGPRLRAGAAALGLAGTAAIAASVAFAEPADQDRPEYRPIRTAISSVNHALRTPERRILVTGSHSFTAFDFRAALVYALRAQGLRPFATGAKPRFGDFYDLDHHRYQVTVSVWDGFKPPGGGRVIARIGLAAAIGRQITVTVKRAPGRAAGSGRP